MNLAKALPVVVVAVAAALAPVTAPPPRPRPPLPPRPPSPPIPAIGRLGQAESAPRRRPAHRIGQRAALARSATRSVYAATAEAAILSRRRSGVEARRRHRIDGRNA